MERDANMGFFKRLLGLERAPSGCTVVVEVPEYLMEDICRLADKDASTKTKQRTWAYRLWSLVETFVTFPTNSCMLKFHNATKVRVHCSVDNFNDVDTDMYDVSLSRDGRTLYASLKDDGAPRCDQFEITEEDHEELGKVAELLKAGKHEDAGKAFSELVVGRLAAQFGIDPADVQGCGIAVVSKDTDTDDDPTDVEAPDTIAMQGRTPNEDGGLTQKCTCQGSNAECTCDHDECTCSE